MKEPPQPSSRPRWQTWRQSARSCAAPVIRPVQPPPLPFYKLPAPQIAFTPPGRERSHLASNLKFRSAPTYSRRPHTEPNIHPHPQLPVSITPPLQRSTDVLRDIAFTAFVSYGLHSAPIDHERTRLVFNVGWYLKKKKRA